MEHYPPLNEDAMFRHLANSNFISPFKILNTLAKCWLSCRSDTIRIYATEEVVKKEDWEL
jgi:hypothetical protein